MGECMSLQYILVYSGHSDLLSEVWIYIPKKCHSVTINFQFLCRCRGVSELEALIMFSGCPAGLLSSHSCHHNKLTIPF